MANIKEIQRPDPYKTNIGHSFLQKSKQPREQKKPDKQRVPAVTPDNDSGAPGAPADKDTSNVGKCPSGENL